mmetsp:Transcript_38009/g.88834  ORF Transcript_38009/g.88834 Transcript_38009/m.88834 type:complete len:793 (-) Transcript_38009:57-2435(-)
MELQRISGLVRALSFALLLRSEGAAGSPAWRITGLWPPERTLPPLVCYLSSPVLDPEDCCTFQSASDDNLTANSSLLGGDSNSSFVNETNTTNATNLTTVNSSSEGSTEGNGSSLPHDCSLQDGGRTLVPNCQMRVYSDSSCSEEVPVAVSLPECVQDDCDIESNDSSVRRVALAENGMLHLYSLGFCSQATAAGVKCIRLHLPQEWLSISDDALLRHLDVQQGKAWSLLQEDAILAMLDTQSTLNLASLLSGTRDWFVDDTFVARWISRRTGDQMPELILYSGSSFGVPLRVGVLLSLGLLCLLWLLVYSLAPSGFFTSVIARGSGSQGSLIPLRHSADSVRPDSVIFADPRAGGATMTEVIAFSHLGFSQGCSDLCGADFLSAAYPIGPDVLQVDQILQGIPQSWVCGSAKEALDVLTNNPGPAYIRLLSPSKHREHFKPCRVEGTGKFEVAMAVLRAKFARGSQWEQLLVRTGDAYLLARGDQTSWSDLRWESGIADGAAPLDNGLGLQLMLIRASLTHKTGWRDFLQNVCGLDMSAGRMQQTSEWNVAVMEAEKALKLRLSEVAICCVAALHFIDCMATGAPLEEARSNAMTIGWEIFDRQANLLGEWRSTDALELMHWADELREILEEAPALASWSGLSLTSSYHVTKLLDQVMALVSQTHEYAVSVIFAAADKTLVATLNSVRMSSLNSGSKARFCLFSPYPLQRDLAQPTTEPACHFRTDFQDVEKLARAIFRALQSAPQFAGGTSSRAAVPTPAKSQLRRQRARSSGATKYVAVACNITAWTFY